MWMPYDQMSRLEQKMFWAVRESAMLHELPLPEVDDPGSTNEVSWAAEEPADCARVLLGWLNAGLVCVISTDEQRDLPSADAREVLANYTAWSPAYSLVLTDAGEFGLPEQTPDRRQERAIRGKIVRSACHSVPHGSCRSARDSRPAT